jgi:hypothetical protein
MNKSATHLAALAAIITAGAVSTASAALSTYEDLSEGFLGATFTHDGVTYRDVNNVSGFYPDGNPFGPTDNGDQNIIERATLFYNDFPTYGSPVNSMTFGNAFVDGDNLSIGALASVWMDVPAHGSAASFDLAYYENGPWGNIQYKLDAVRNGQVVASDVFTIANGGGRDNPTFRHMSVSGVEFDSLHLYGWLNGNYTVPRGMIDDLTIAAVPEPATTTLVLTPGITMALSRRSRRRRG